MTYCFKRAGLALLGALLLLTSYTPDAAAYGPEGLFGGRPEPDSTVVLNNSVQPDYRPDRSQSVLEHPRPDYDPVPLEFGSFNFLPVLRSRHVVRLEHLWLTKQYRKRRDL